MACVSKLRLYGIHHGLYVGMCLAGMLAGHSCLLSLLDVLCKAHVSGILTAQGELSQSQRIGTIGRGLARRDQLVGRRHGIMDLADNAEHQVLRQRAHCRPVLDVRTKVDLCVRICHALGIKYAVRVNLGIEMIFVLAELTVEIGRRRQHALVCSRCRDGSCIHEGHGRDLTVLKLASLSVREVSGGVTDGECIVCRRVAGAKARSAEGRLHHGARLKDRCGAAVSDQLHVNRHGSGIDTQGELIRADVLAL